MTCVYPVSYTHLDVYKRQTLMMAVEGTAETCFCRKQTMFLPNSPERNFNKVEYCLTIETGVGICCF